MNLTIQKDEIAHTKDRRFKPIKPKFPKPSMTWIMDISSLAIRKQHKKRYLRLRENLYLEIDFVVLYNHRKKRGFFRFIDHKVKYKDIQDFVKEIGIDKSVIFHDKGYIFRFGIQYHSQREKQIIESRFGFKRWIYRAYKNKEISTAKDLFDIYRKYLAKLNLKEV